MVPPLIGPGNTIRKSGGGSHRLSADFYHSLARGKQMGGVLEKGGQDVRWAVKMSFYLVGDSGGPMTRKVDPAPECASVVCLQRLRWP